MIPKGDWQPLKGDLQPTIRSSKQTFLMKSHPMCFLYVSKLISHVSQYGVI